MMWAFKYLPLMSVVDWAFGQTDSLAPGCALRCWENTKYVSKCSGDIECFCSEVQYQNSVFQCLYSQCDTSHFGSALHHAIAQCFGTDHGILSAALPVASQEFLRRREAGYAGGARIYGSGSVALFPTDSAKYLAGSTLYATQSIAGTYSPGPTSSYPLPAFLLNSAASPAITSAIPTEPAYNAVPISTTAAAPQLYTGGSVSSQQSLALLNPPHVLAAFVLGWFFLPIL